eukprot:305450-Alexandrium_andersonii.AAC.1
MPLHAPLATLTSETSSYTECPPRALGRVTAATKAPEPRRQYPSRCIRTRPAPPDRPPRRPAG